MENLDPSDRQGFIVSEIFRSAALDEKPLSLGLLLKAYDVVIKKHGINATDFLGLQIYRSLLQWGRHGAALAAKERHSPRRQPRPHAVPHAVPDVVPHSVPCSVPHAVPQSEHRKHDRGAHRAPLEPLEPLEPLKWHQEASKDDFSEVKEDLPERLSLQSGSILAEAFAYRKILARALTWWTHQLRVPKVVDLHDLHRRQALKFWHHRTTSQKLAGAHRARWLRTRLEAVWQVWLAWHRKRGVVIAMRSGPQMLASWRWLRVHAAAHPTRPRLHLSGVQLRDGAPWQQVTAAEILFGSAPFQVHPHHMKVMQEDILMIFASTLLKKMMAAWVHEVQSIRMLFEQAKRREKHRSMDAWKGAATRCRRLREHQLRVSHQRCNQTLARAIRLWEQRWSKWVQHRRSLQEFDVACWHRICRRAMDAWIRVVQLEVQSVRMLFEQAKRREKHRSMDAWKGAATRCRCLREHQLRVSHQRCNQTLARAIRLWEQRWSKWVRHRRSLQEFDVACWHRICRRAMDAWVKVLQLEAIAAKVRSSLNLRLQLMVFQVWVAQWHHDRKESVLLRLSALFLRKRGLKCGVRAFQRNVCSETRKRALAEAQERFRLEAELDRRKVAKVPFAIRCAC
ncbi:unnamed protein product [Durusdinium trenchii]|uniref:Sfi1 spindle body domain-containing protein n=1 Tax=Durusdinium trenchii TaxID=1381693 RepID=A0ABP0M0G0_9DINO